MMNLPITAALDLDLTDGWLTVWFNDPQNRNPLSAERVQDLLAVCDFLNASPAVRGVVLRGRGGVFCAGGDLKAFRTVFQGAGSADTVIRASMQAGTLLERLKTLPQFVVVVVEGAAMAGGFGIACIGDYVIADTTAKFALSEVRIGIPPAQIAPYVVDRIGPRQAKLLMLTGQPLDAGGAARIGLIDEVATGTDDLAAALEGIKARLRHSAPQALAGIKRQLAQLPTLDPEARRHHAAQLFANHLLSDEGREGVASFVEKRPPAWAVR